MKILGRPTFSEFFARGWLTAFVLVGTLAILLIGLDGGCVYLFSFTLLLIAYLAGLRHGSQRYQQLNNECAQRMLLCEHVYTCDECRRNLVKPTDFDDLDAPLPTNMCEHGATLARWTIEIPPKRTP